MVTKWSWTGVSDSRAVFGAYRASHGVTSQLISIRRRVAKGRAFKIRIKILLSMCISIDSETAVLSFHIPSSISSTGNQAQLSNPYYLP